MDRKYQFMVDFTMPEVLTNRFMDLVPYQRAMVNRYLKDGKLANYSLSLDNQKLWAVFNANSEVEVLDMLADLPLTKFMETEISLLTFHNTAKLEVLTFSMN